MEMIKKLKSLFIKSNIIEIGDEVIIKKDSYEGIKGEVLNILNDEYHIGYLYNNVLCLYEHEFEKIDKKKIVFFKNTWYNKYKKWINDIFTTIKNMEGAFLRITLDGEYKRS